MPELVVETGEQSQDINEKLVEGWAKETAGRDSCTVMANMLAGVLSLEKDPETKSVYDSLRQQGFDQDKMISLIGNCCEAVPKEQEAEEEVRLVEEVSSDKEHIGEGGEREEL